MGDLTSINIWIDGAHRASSDIAAFAYHIESDLNIKEGLRPFGVRQIIKWKSWVVL